MLLEVVVEVVAALVAVGRILRERLVQDAGDLFVHVRVQLADVGRVGLHHVEHQLQRTVVVEGHAPAEHFEQHDTQREDIGTLVHHLAQADLGRKVTRRADEGAGIGELGRDVLVGQRDAEIGHLHLAARGDHDVAGLDIAMDHALRVRGSKTLRGVQKDLQRVARYQADFALQAGRQRFAVDVFHHKEGLFFVLADEVDLDDVRVVERRHRARFAQEAFDEYLVVRHGRGQHLDRHVATQR